MLAAIDPWSWRPHPEVWLLLAAIIGLGLYATRVIGPKVVREGEVVSARQKRFFVLGVVVFALAADWPMHDIAEEYLYSVHMLQHLLITFFIPILFLQATPEWLARLILGGGDQERTWVGKLAKPIVAGIIFNALAALTHWNGIVQLSFDSGPFHYSIHLVMFTAALLMWLPVLGPLPELRLSPPAQMIYLFLMSIIPTIPAGWLTFADNPVYPAYDTVERLWDIGVVADQQAAGFVMKIFGGFFLWGLIAARFFRWAADERAQDMERPVVKPLTFDDVADEFEKAGPATSER
ncbi:MAG: putative membrane protein [Verrucomicrobiales bacterium]|jgi:putative membrane protein